MRSQYSGHVISFRPIRGQQCYLEPGALVSKLPDPVQNQVDNLLADGVVAPGVVVGGILLACYQLLGVEQLAIRSSADLI